MLQQFQTHEDSFNLRGCKTITAVINTTDKTPWMGTNINFNWRQDMDFFNSCFCGISGNGRIVIIVGIVSALLCGIALHC